MNWEAPAHLDVITADMGGTTFDVGVIRDGEPLNRTTTIGYYLYTNAFRELEMGYATAMAFVLFAMIFGFTLIQWKYTRGDVEY